jgi:hypothetical protein
MNYIVGAVVVTIAVVLGIFTGVWGGLIWILFAAVIAAALFMAKARTVPVDKTFEEPTGRPRSASASPGTANERVGQG